MRGFFPQWYPPRIRIAWLTYVAVVMASVATQADEGLEFFEQKIRPVLVDRCFKCHAADSPKLKGGLRLDQRAGLLTGGDSGPAIVPGQADASLLMKVIRWSDGVSEMPPDGKLPDRVIADFREWIQRGAAFPPDTAGRAAKPRPVDIATGRSFWSFQPVQVLPLPNVSLPDWTTQKLDYFVLEKLDREHMQPAARADRRTLIRRLSLDFLGLPPTYQEVESFVADPDPDAYSRLVDRYLASPHYGERWARHWLDLARYAEDHPTSESTCKPPRFAFRFRDWVIRALNEDLPYNEFVRRQLAADQLELPASEIAALGFLGLSPVYHKEPKLSAEVISVIVADEWDERLDTITRGFLGLTVACARCHDHKFDPIKTDDYYALAGVLASTQLVEAPLVPTDFETAQALNEVQREIVDVELRFDYAKRNRKTAQGDLLDLTTFDEEVTRWEERLKVLKATKLFDGPIANAARDAGLWLNGDDPAWTLLDYRPGQPRDLPIFIRGNPASPGAIVSRRFLEVLSPSGSQPFQNGSGRRELADAIVTDAASLTARVIVNRIWGWHFDRPLVATTSNFGRLGDAPSHPDLLDDLAARFIESGWSLKWLHREILLSATWCQSCQSPHPYQDRDPDNRQLWRMNRKRLEAEAWRDSVLAVSGKLDRTLFGPSFELNDVNQFRRTVYGVVSRQKPADLFRLFDFPDAKRHSENRLPTTTPLQHLYLLNSPFLRQQAEFTVHTVIQNSEKVVASRDAATDPAGDVDQSAQEDSVRAIYQRILLRNPTREELDEALAFLRVERSEIPLDNWILLAHSLLAMNEFLFVE
jgi:hypothetical protein